jgi:nicotinate-nucleotide adenylyltransferase
MGLLGGTFDPIHLGHLRAAENAREALGLDRVAFVPARVPPHRAEPAAPALDRFVMVALATAGRPEFVPSDSEILRDGPSYTVDTVAAFKERDPEGTVVLIIGADNLDQLPQWREPGRILELSELAVVDRPGQEAPTPPALSRGRVHHVPGRGLPISSREIRARLRSGASVRDVLTAEVLDYITKRGLYRPVESA